MRTRNCRLLLCGLLSIHVTLSARAAHAEVQQAPGSRVAIDLPTGFTPARAYSGFENAALSSSFVIMEMPGEAFDQVKAGLTPEALAGKGITKVQLKSLARPDPHVYLSGEQPSPMGRIAKFMLVIRDGNASALISGNIPTEAIDSGKLTVAAVEAALKSARIASTAMPEKPLFTLTDIGSFKSAGSVAGTAKAYTLDGSLAPPPGAKSTGRELFLVAPSLDARPVGDLEAFTKAALLSLAGAKDLKVATFEPVAIGGLKGLASTASGRDTNEDRPLHVYHVVLVNPAGGYYRLVGMTYDADPKPRLAEFERMANSFKPID